MPVRRAMSRLRRRLGEPGHRGRDDVHARREPREGEPPVEAGRDVASSRAIARRRVRRRCRLSRPSQRHHRSRHPGARLSVDDDAGHAAGQRGSLRQLTARKRDPGNQRRQQVHTVSAGHSSRGRGSCPASACGVFPRIPNPACLAEAGRQAVWRRRKSPPPGRGLYHPVPAASGAALERVSRDLSSNLAYSFCPAHTSCADGP